MSADDRTEEYRGYTITWSFNGKDGDWYANGWSDDDLAFGYSGESETLAVEDCKRDIDNRLDGNS